MHCYASKTKLLRLLVLTVVMVGVSLVCAMMENPLAQVFGWIGVVFFGLGFLVIPARLFHTGPLVIIDEEGIEDRRSGWRVPWHAVDAVWTASMYRNDFLCLDVEEPMQYVIQPRRWKHRLLQGVAQANHFLGFPPVTISFQEVTPGLDEAWAYIDEVFSPTPG